MNVLKKRMQLQSINDRKINQYLAKYMIDTETEVSHFLRYQTLRGVPDL